MKNNQTKLLTATLAYLEDWADDGHSIIPSSLLTKYGFSKLWLRTVERVHQSQGGKHDVWLNDEVVPELTGIWTLDLLDKVVQELGITGYKYMGGRGSQAQEYTKAIREFVAKQSAGLTS